MAQMLAAITERAGDNFGWAVAEPMAELPAEDVPDNRGEATVDDDALMVARTRQGDLNAFNQLVLKYQNLAYGIAFRLLPSREAAADAVQESFLKAFRSLSTFHNGSFKSWLARIVVNTCHDANRINRRMVLEPIADEPLYDDSFDGGDSRPHQLADGRESPHAYVERMELAARIELGLRALPEEQRLALVLCDIYGYNYDEICAITGMPMGTIKSRISRGRMRLRDFLLEKPELLT